MARVKTKRFYVVGIKGKIVGIYNDPIEASCHGKSRTPIFEFVPVNMVGIQASSYQPLLSSPSRKAERTIVADLAHKFYGKRDDYGCFGDVIQISRHRLPSGYLYVVDSMMWRAYIKPGLASDLVLFVQDRTGKIFLILIRRKNEPGAGTIAAPGGFLNVGVYDIETGVRCALREGSEEISVGMFPRSPDHKYQDDPNIDGFLISVDIGGKEINSYLKYLGIYITEKKEQIPVTSCNKLQIKRVYWTFAYTAIVRTDFDLDVESAAALFKAADDAKEIIAVPFKDVPMLELGLKHHREFIDVATAYIKTSVG